MVDNNGTTKEIEFPLFGFTGGKCGRVTDIKKRVLSNRDACLLLLAANGPICKTGTLITLLRAWRPLEGVTYNYRRGAKDLITRSGKFELCFKYLFNSYYGHTCGNIEGRPYKSMYGRDGHPAVSYFWSNKRGEVKITHAGFRRLSYLIQEMGRECCIPDCLLAFDIPERFAVVR